MMVIDEHGNKYRACQECLAPATVRTKRKGQAWKHSDDACFEHYEIVVEGSIMEEKVRKLLKSTAFSKPPTFQPHIDTV